MFLARLMAAAMLLAVIPFLPEGGPAAQAATEYTLNALLVEGLPGVYKVTAAEGADKASATIGIPSISKDALSDHPTKESPAIIMGAAVNYEKKTGPTEYTPIEGAKLLAPYSYFRWKVIDEQLQDEQGNVTTHKKLSGFDGTYYIVRVDLSDLLKNVTDPENKFLHVKQESNSALMVALGIEGTSFADGMGNKNASYSLANNMAVLKDTVGEDQNTPYLDVVVMSSGKLVAGADTGKQNAPSADIGLSFYVDETEDYDPSLKYDPASTDTNHAANVLKKFYRDEAAQDAASQGVTSYTIKGSDLEIDSMAYETEASDSIPEYWSLTKSIAYQPYNAHTIHLICEAPVLEGLHIEGTAENKRSVILDVNSYDIQIANHSETKAAGLRISKYAELKIMDGTKTAGAELAIGNNATMVIEDGGTLLIDESCVNEVEYDAASITGEQTEPTAPLNNGEITVKNGGKIINYGVINVEGMEAKPQAQNTQEQQQQETVTRDMRPAVMLVEEGGELQNYGALSVKGILYVMGKVTNYGKYTDIIQANDPDKGKVPYHKGIQITWKDDVRNPDVVPGVLNLGYGPENTKNRLAELWNEGDIVIAPGELNIYGNLYNAGKIYLADVDEAVVPITPTQEAPLVREIRVAVDPMRPGMINIDQEATLNLVDAASGIVGAKIHVVSNGQLGDITVTGDAKGDPAWLKQGACVIGIDDGFNTFQTFDEVLTVIDGGVKFTDTYLNSFTGKRTVKVNVGFRYYEFTAESTLGDWHKSSKGWWLSLKAGGFARNQWLKVDGSWYYFDADGYMETRAIRNGYYLGADGRWAEESAKAIGWKHNSKGWWYQLDATDCLTYGWEKIDGSWYYFKKNGFAAQNEYVAGWWFNNSCKWVSLMKYSWHKTARGWWYGTDGWYAKSGSYTIDGKVYNFDQNGYCLNP